MAVLVATLAGYAVFAIVALVVDSAQVTTFDRSLILALREAGDVANPLGPPWFEETAAEITALGGYPILILVALLVVIALLLLGKQSAALFLVASLVGGAVLSSGLKELFSRPRPDLVDHLDRTFTNSFPSAHAMVSMLALLTLAAVASRFVPRRAFSIYAVGAAVLISILIGASRVYLGVHWPSDVVAGWALGVGWAGTSWLVAHFIAHHSSAEADLGQSTVAANRTERTR